MATVRVRANCNVFGLEVGDIADVDDSGEFGDLIAADLVSLVETAPAAPSTDEVLFTDASEVATFDGEVSGD